MRVARFTGTGDASILRLADEAPHEPGPGEVRIRVTSAGLNRADALCRAGRYLLRSPGESRTGFEGAGVVEAVGQDVRTCVGDRVGVLPSSFDVVNEGAAAEAMTVPEAVVVPTPRGVADRDAGAIWMQYLTAWGALVDIAATGPGDFVVVPATTSAAKVRALEAFGPHAVVDTRHEPNVERVREITGGNGARVIFDPVYGPLVNDHLRVACREAVVFVYGALDPTPLTLDLGGMLRKQIRLQGYTIGPLLGDPARRTRAVADVTARLERGELAPVVDSYFPLDRIQEAHRRLESNQQIGKVVVTPTP